MKKHHFLIVFALFLAYFFWPKTIQNKNNVVNVYAWSGYIPDSVQKKFLEETGIRVNVSLMDSDEALESKILTGHEGYDIVFPSTPYVFKHMTLDVYTSLTEDKIPNLALIDKKIFNRFKSGDKILVAPYLWGTTGFVYNKDIFDKLFPGEEIDSWVYLYDPEKLEKIKRHGVVFFGSAHELFLSASLYGGADPENLTEEDLLKADKMLHLARPYIFSAAPSGHAAQSVLSGEAVIAASSSGDVSRVKSVAKARGLDLQYVFPKEGIIRWVDSMAILKSAPHKENAFKLLNFLLRPDVIAEVSQASYFPNAVPDSKKYIPEAYFENPAFNPPAEVMKRLRFDGNYSLALLRQMNRLYFKVLMSQ